MLKPLGRKATRILNAIKFLTAFRILVAFLPRGFSILSTNGYKNLTIMDDIVILGDGVMFLRSRSGTNKVRSLCPGGKFSIDGCQNILVEGPCDIGTIRPGNSSLVVAYN